MIELMQRKTYAEGARIGAAVHNRFDIEVQNIETGEVRKFQALNMVLDQMWTRLCGRSTYFVNIHFGTGTGTLAASRTSLFTHLGTKTATNDAQSKALPTSYWRRKIVLAPEEYVGSTLTEVGVAYGATSTNLVTHALLRDMNGNVTSLLKTALDVVTIYATVYVTFSTSNANLKICSMAGDNNPLINYLIGNSSFPTLYFYSGAGVDTSGKNTLGLVAAEAFKTASLTLTADAANKKFYTNTLRLAIGESNEHLTEFSLGGASSYQGIFNLRLPAAGIYSGLALSGVSVGTGDGATQEYVLPSKNIDQSSIKLYLDAVETTAFTKAVINNKVVNHAIQRTQSQYTGGGGIGVSSDGVYLAQSHSSAPYLIPFKLEDGGYVARATPSEYPGSVGLDAAISDDGNTMVLGHYTSGVYAYKMVNGAWVRKTFDIAPSGNVSAVSLSSNGLILAVATNSSPYVYTYDWVEGSNQWIKRINPATPPTGSGSCVKLSPDGTKLVIAHDSSPYVTFYDWTAGAWVKRANPSSLLGANGKTCGLSDDGNVMFVNSFSGWSIAVYDWIGSAWNRRTNPTALGTYGYYCALSADGTKLAIGSGDGIKAVYIWSGSAWASYSLPTLPTSAVYGIRILSNKIVFSDGGSANPRVLDISALQTKITFNSAPANGAVITADYTVNGIHKTNQRVIDLYAEIVFGEPV